MKGCSIKQSNKSPEQPIRHSLSENIHLTPEFRLVAACSWVPTSGHLLAQTQIIDSLSLCELNWDEVAALTLRHGVVGQFCTVMGKRGWAHVPVATRERLKSCRTQQAVKALGQVAELAKISRLFAGAGIQHIPLKGVALSQELYGDPCIRSSCDIDIIVKPECVEKAEELLIQAGYHHAFGFHGMNDRQKRHLLNTLHHHEYVHNTRGVHIELHWRSYLWPQDRVAALWDTGRSSAWLDSGLMQLAKEENILFLADHGARHGWPCLKWLSDIAMLMEKMPEDEWLSLYNRAAFFDLQRVMCHTAVLLEWFYGIEPPQEIRERSETNTVVQNLSVLAASQLLASGDEIASQAKNFAGIRLAIRTKRLKPSTPLSDLLRSILIIQADLVESPLPDVLFWLYFPLRPYLWLKRRLLKR